MRGDASMQRFRRGDGSVSSKDGPAVLSGVLRLVGSARYSFHLNNKHRGYQLPWSSDATVRTVCFIHTLLYAPPMLCSPQHNHPVSTCKAKLPIPRYKNTNAARSDFRIFELSRTCLRPCTGAQWQLSARA